MAIADARYRDASLPVEARAADLLARMALGEKVAQMGSVWSFELLGKGSLDPARAKSRAIGIAPRPYASALTTAATFAGRTRSASSL